MPDDTICIKPHDAQPGAERRTLIRLSSEEFPRFRDELCLAVRSLFPAFGFTPVQMERFLAANAEPFEDAHYLLMDGEMPLAVCMRCDSLVEYVIPLQWPNRYEVVADALRFLSANGDADSLEVRIKEDMPSHNSWYAALLPAMGFSMTPRVRMGVPVTVVASNDSALDSVRQMQPEWIESCLDVYKTAYGLTAETFESLEESIRSSLDMQDRLQSWVVAFEQDTVVGACFGSHHRNRFFIEELAVSEAHRCRGLGQSLLVQTVTRLATLYPQVDSVVLDVDRLNIKAIRLYTKLGFVATDNYTIARRA